nr:phosphotransferase [Streptomyces sp. ODS25]
MVGRGALRERAVPLVRRDPGRPARASGCRRRTVDSLWRLWYGVNPPDAWDRWLAAGHAGDRSWAPALRRHRGLIDDLTARIDAAYRAVDDHVVTHRDVVPHNVLIDAARGPVLIDWDTAGPDSATLETAATVFDGARHAGGGQEPDPAWIAAALDAYQARGGQIRSSEFLLARRLGVHLARCAERLRISLGEDSGGSLDPAAAEERAARHLAALPEFSSWLLDWSRRLV